MSSVGQGQRRAQDMTIAVSKCSQAPKFAASLYHPPPDHAKYDILPPPAMCVLDLEIQTHEYGPYTDATHVLTLAIAQGGLPGAQSNQVRAINM